MQNELLGNKLNEYIFFKNSRTFHLIITKCEVCNHILVNGTGTVFPHPSFFNITDLVFDIFLIFSHTIWNSVPFIYSLVLISYSFF